MKNNSKRKLYTKLFTLIILILSLIFYLIKNYLFPAQPKIELNNSNTFNVDTDKISSKESTITIDEANKTKPDIILSSETETEVIPKEVKSIISVNDYNLIQEKYKRVKFYQKQLNLNIIENKITNEDINKTFSQIPYFLKLEGKQITKLTITELQIMDTQLNILIQSYKIE